jgi:hypothetical protein
MNKAMFLIERFHLSLKQTQRTAKPILDRRRKCLTPLPDN